MTFGIGSHHLFEIIMWLRKLFFSSHIPRGKRHTYRLDNGRQSPLGAEKSMAVQLSRRIYMSVQYVNSNHARVHRVWVLLHCSGRNGFPWVAAK